MEEVIYDRQNRRAHLIALALDPVNIKEDDKVIRGVGDDARDDSDFEGLEESGEVGMIRVQV